MPPGGLPDTVARIAGQHLQERIGQSVVVENRPGGGAAAAMGALWARPPTATRSSSPTARPSRPTRCCSSSCIYNPKDIVPVALLGTHAAVPRGASRSAGVDAREFVDYVKAHPGEINYGSSGVGSAHHLSMEAMKAALKLADDPRSLSRHRPIGAGAAGRSCAGAVLGLSVAGRRGRGQEVKLLATNGAKRSPRRPTCRRSPTSFPAYDLATIVGLFARVGTPPALIQKIAVEAMAAVNAPETRKQLEGAGIEPDGQGTEAFAKYLSAETAYVGKVIESLTSRSNDGNRGLWNASVEALCFCGVVGGMRHGRGVRAGSGGGLSKPRGSSRGALHARRLHRSCRASDGPEAFGGLGSPVHHRQPAGRGRRPRRRDGGQVRARRPDADGDQPGPQHLQRAAAQERALCGRRSCTGDRVRLDAGDYQSPIRSSRRTT